jgi:hypothetical protein
MGGVAIIMMFGYLSALVVGTVNGVWHLIESNGGILNHIYEAFIGVLLGSFYGFFIAVLAFILMIIIYVLFQKYKPFLEPIKNKNNKSISS